MYAVIIVTECPQRYLPATFLTGQDSWVNIKIRHGLYFSIQEQSAETTTLYFTTYKPYCVFITILQNSKVY